MNNTTSAMEVLRLEKNRTRFWFTAFLLTITAFVTMHFTERKVRHDD